MSLRSVRDWLDFFADAGISYDRAKMYAASVVENKRTDVTLQELNRESLRDLGIVISRDVFDIVNHAKRMSTMASACDSNQKRTSESNVDDASVPTAKRMCNNLDNDQKDKVIQSIEENPASALALSKLLSCKICKFFARAPIQYCGRGHTICSLCYTEEGAQCPADSCTEKLMPKGQFAAFPEITEAIHAMKLPVPCRNQKNGCQEIGEEKAVEEHEIECAFRIIPFPCTFGGGNMIFKEIHLMVVADFKDHEGKWFLCDKKIGANHFNKAYRDFVEPDGHIFRIILSARDCRIFKAYAVVLGGERVANKYRVELRLSSNEKDVTTTHHGPVFSVDARISMNSESIFTVHKEKFASFNKGFDYFGYHNMGKNGEVVVPIMVKIIKKELGIPKVAMDEEEK